MRYCCRGMWTHLFCYTTWTLTKCLGIKPEGSSARMLHAVFNKSRKQHPTKLHPNSSKTSKTFWVLLRKLGRIHKWRFLGNSYARTHQCRLTRKTCLIWMLTSGTCQAWLTNETNRGRFTGLGDINTRIIYIYI